jgi:hypothetical protein
MKLMLWDPGATPVKIPVVFTVTPSRVKVTGATPVEVTTMPPLFTPGQLAADGVAVAVTVELPATVVLTMLVQLVLSVTSMLWAPAATPVKIPVEFVVPPSNTKV